MLTTKYVTHMYIPNSQGWACGSSASLLISYVVCPTVLKVAGTVLKHANYSLLAVTTVMQYAHTYVSVAARLPALRVINVRVHVRFHREAILPELAHPWYISRQAIPEPVERRDRFCGLD